MMREFRAGEAVPIGESVVRFRASPAVDLCALIVSDELLAGDPEDFVFYGNPSAPGIRLVSDGLEIEFSKLRPGTERVWCIASDDGKPVTVDATLEPVGTFGPPPENVVICWELYLLRGQWKVRALGQGYAGGLAELLTRHGIEVDDPAPISESLSPALHPPSPAVLMAPAADQITAIYEDAARAIASYVSTARFADEQLDKALEESIASPELRNSPAANDARKLAEQKAEDLHRQARERLETDAQALRAEMAALADTLPRALAPWSAPIWNSDLPEPDPGGEIRIGTFVAPIEGVVDVPALRAFPLRSPMWIIAESSITVADSVRALLIRLLAVTPYPRLDFVDPGNELGGLVPAFAPVIAGAPGSLTERIQNLYLNADLDQLALKSGDSIPDRSRHIIVVSGFPLGFARDDAVRLLAIVNWAADLEWTVIIVGPDPADTDDPAVQMLKDACQLLSPEFRTAEPWTGLPWRFVLDSAPNDDRLVDRILSARRSEGQH